MSKGLTDLECRGAKAADKPVKLYDSGGLYLLVKPNGSKLWQMKYAYDGKAKTYSIGQYGQEPSGVGIGKARDERDAAKKVLREGRDPTLVRQLARVSNVVSQSVTLEQVCDKWITKNILRWSPKHGQNVQAVFDAEVYPTLGKFPIGEITSGMILRKVLEPMDKRGTHETCRRVRQRLSAVYRFAAVHDFVPKLYDPASVALLEGLQPKRQVQHQPAIIEIEALREMMRKVEETPCKPTTKLATRFIALTSVRVATMMGARWEQFSGLDGAKPVWDIPEP